MTKEAFLQELIQRLHQLPPEEVKRQRDYYDELLQDMMEDGMDEAEAVSKLGDPAQIAQDILEDTSLHTLVKTRIRPKNGWTTAAVIAAIVGAPLWLPLGLALLATGFAVVVSIWAVIFSIFVVVLSLLVAGVFVFCKGFALFPLGFGTGLFSLGAGLVMLGVGCLVFVAAVYGSTALLHGSKWIYRKVKGLFIAKEA